VRTSQPLIPGFSQTINPYFLFLTDRKADATPPPSIRKEVIPGNIFAAWIEEFAKGKRIAFTLKRGKEFRHG
jgi:hypothetical protein